MMAPSSGLRHTAHSSAPSSPAHNTAHHSTPQHGMTRQSMQKCCSRTNTQQTFNGEACVQRCSVMPPWATWRFASWALEAEVIAHPAAPEHHSCCLYPMPPCPFITPPSLPPTSISTHLPVLPAAWPAARGVVPLLRLLRLMLLLPLLP